MTAVGVDGTSDGWLAVEYDAARFSGAAQYDDVEALWTAHSRADVMLIDVPIGLREESNEPRRCDSLARDRLSPHRHASVFPTPVRSAAHAECYETAKAVQERRTAGSLGTQTWAISEKIAELDTFLRDNDAARATIREAHPEVCFWAVNEKQPMACSKTARPLMAFWERVAALERVSTDAIHDIQRAAERLQTEASNDDLLDAFVLAVTAIQDTTALRTLPRDPEEDPKGLPMEMVYAEFE